MNWLQTLYWGQPQEDNLEDRCHNRGRQYGVAKSIFLFVWWRAPRWLETSRHCIFELKTFFLCEKSLSVFQFIRNYSELFWRMSDACKSYAFCVRKFSPVSRIVDSRMSWGLQPTKAIPSRSLSAVLTPSVSINSWSLPMQSKKKKFSIESFVKWSQTHKD